MAQHRYIPTPSASVQTSGTSRYCYGKPHAFDPSFRGPVHSRSCTDVFCCLLFAFVLFSYSVLGLLAWLHGDPRKVLLPTDSQGQLCGQQGSINEDRPLLFYFNILKCANPAVFIHLQCPTTQMCVSRCPDRFITFSEMQLQQRLGLGRGSWDNYRHFCKPGFSNISKPVSLVLRDEDCPSLLVPSRAVFQRCVPDHSTRSNGTPEDNRTLGANVTKAIEALQNTPSMKELQDATKGVTHLLDSRQMGLKVMEDFAKSWSWILSGLLLALLLSLLFILVLRFTAGLVLGLMLLSFILMLAYGIWLSAAELSRLRNSPGSEVTISELGFHMDLQLYLQLQQTWTIILVALGVAEAAFLLLLVFMRRRVRVAVALLREASKAVGQIMSSLFYPVVTFILLSVCFSFWAFTALHLSSSGEPIYKVMSPDQSCLHANRTCNPQMFASSVVHSTPSCSGSQCLFAFYGGETLLHRHLLLLQMFNLLVLLWLLNFILALQRCTLAGAFSSYYWALRKPRDIPPCPLYSSFTRTLRYHTGSLAFGSLILSVVQLLRIILEYVQAKLTGLNNPVSRFILCCLRCCFWCLDRFLRYMNHNAYIMVALYGKNFCASAREAFFLLMRNVVRVTVVDHLTDVLLFLGKVLIAAAVGAVGFLFLTKQLPMLRDEVPPLHYTWLPLLTVALGSYLIAHGFFSVYAMCVDTLFICFCDDLERNDGSPERPYFMSPELHRILRKPKQSH